MRSDHDGGRCSIAADVDEGGRGADGYEFDVENVDDGDKSMMIFKISNLFFAKKKLFLYGLSSRQSNFGGFFRFILI